MTQSDDPGRYLRRAIAAMPYRPPIPVSLDLRGDRSGPPVRQLSLNESPRPPSPRVFEAIGAALRSINRYGDPKYRALTAALAGRTDVPADRIVIGSGSDEILGITAQITLEPGAEAVMPAPSFPRYAISAQAAGGTVRKVGLLPDGRNDVDGLLSAVTDKTRVLYCCTPNNPSGAALDADELDALARGTPDHVLLIVDEAYHEFSLEAGGPDALAVVRRRRGPWAVLRTFSKVYCLAGLRIGYALCGSSYLAEALTKPNAMFNVNALAPVAALAALGDEAYARSLLAACATERRRLAEGAVRLGLEALPSATNFVSFRITADARPVVARLRDCGILVRAWADPGYEDHLRVTVGTAEDTDAVLAALGDVLRSGSAADPLSGTAA